MVGMPYYTSPLLSVWPSHLRFPIGRPAPVIPQQIMNNVKMVDFVGIPMLIKDMRLIQKHSNGIKLHHHMHSTFQNLDRNKEAKEEEPFLHRFISLNFRTKPLN